MDIEYLHGLVQAARTAALGGANQDVLFALNQLDAALDELEYERYP